jgi:hypothetical protein
VLLYFRPFLEQLPAAEGGRLARGDIMGAGHWKVGDTLVTVLACPGAHPQQAAEFAEWKYHLEQQGKHYLTLDELQYFAREAGVLPASAS